MKGRITRAVGRLLRAWGLDVVRHVDPADAPPPPDMDAVAVATMRAVAAHTMTSAERLYALIQAVRYVAVASIPGSIVECGVWRGGSMMAVARTLLECGDTDRELCLYDTFEGMPPPDARDVDIAGQAASALLKSQSKDDPGSVWCYATLDDARAALASTGYAPGRLRFVKGKVEDTIPAEAPKRIALLRLDTDWYESTRHELAHLYPRLSPGGVLILDDYGHWAGCRKAVDEYFASERIHLLLHRVDYTGRIAVKPA